MARKPAQWLLSIAAGIVLAGNGAVVFAQRTADLGPLLSDVAEAPRDDYRAEPPEPGADQPRDYETPDAASARIGREATAAETATDVQPGTQEVIRERYPNRNVKIEREVAQDENENFVNHGSWKMWDPKGNMIAKGEFQNGRRHGIWRRWHMREDSKLFAGLPYQQFSGPFISQATFRDGLLDGPWLIYDSKQRKISEWVFVEGRRHGPSVWWYANGRKMREINYEDGLLEGIFQEWSPTSQLITDDSYRSGRKLAPRVATDKSGEKIAEGIFLHAKVVIKSPDEWWSARPAVFTKIGKDEKHGIWTSWYTTGQAQMKGEYRNDIEHGIFTWWYPNGQKALEGEYRDGRQQGKWTWWHKNGQKMTQGQFSDGQQIGRWKVWKEDGKLAQAAEHSPADGFGQPPEALEEALLDALPAQQEEPSTRFKR